MATTRVRHLPLRRVAVLTMVAAVAVALAAPIGPAAADPGALEGGPTSGTAVPLPLPADDIDGSFVASNVTISSSSTRSTSVQPYWNNVGWYSFTPSVTVAVYIRATSISPGGWDNTLEVWTAGGTFVTHNDDSYGLDAAITVTLVAGTDYRIGMGGFSSGARGTATLTFSSRAPSAPGNVNAVAGDGQAAVTWDAPADVAGGIIGYTVLCTPSGGAEVPCGSVTGTPPARSRTVTGLTNGTSYDIRVTAQNSIGSSDPSTATSVTPRGVSTVSVSFDPAAPVSGEPFDVVVSVTSHGVPAAGTVDVSGDGLALTGATLVGGVAVVGDVTRAAGPITVSATYSGSTAVAPSSGSATATVAKQSQTVDFAALGGGLTYAGDPVALTASSSSGLPVTFAAIGACAVSDDVLHLVGVGTCTVTATQAGDSETHAASAAQVVEVGKRPQVLTVSDLAPMVYDQTPVAVTATSNVGLAVTVTAAGACTMVDGLLAATGVGDCTVTATQLGDALNAAAAAVVRTAVVSQRSQVVTLSPLPPLILGMTPIPVAATSEFGLAVTIVGAGACSVAEGLVTLVDVGECTVTATAVGDEVTAEGSATTSGVVVEHPAVVNADVGGAGSVGDPVLGAPVSASGEWLRPGTELTLTVYSTPRLIGAAVVAPDGTATVTGMLPSLEPGEHRLVASGVALDGSPVQSEVAFAVGSDGAIAWVGFAPLSLARSGVEIGGAAMLALAWLVLGAALVAARRRLTPGGMTRR